jgi:preprotein translocase subunit SecA
MIMLSVLDQFWKDHLLNMDHLREGIGLRGYGQHDPLVEYKRESFDMFEEMMKRFQEETVRYLYLMQVIGAPEQAVPAAALPSHDGDFNGGGARTVAAVATDGRKPRHTSTNVDEIEQQFLRKKKRELEQAQMAGAGEAAQVHQVVRGAAKVGRNDTCPCGSGKKYKKCCGAPK